MPIPLKTALIGEQSGAEIAPERLIVLDQPSQSVTFDNVTETPLLSINRNFSAPVVLTAQRKADELERLAQADTDPFARYEAMQELMMAALTAGARGEELDVEPVIRAVKATLQSNALDPAFKAEAILVPSDTLIAERMPPDNSDGYLGPASAGSPPIAILYDAISSSSGGLMKGKYSRIGTSTFSATVSVENRAPF